MTFPLQIQFQKIKMVVKVLGKCIYSFHRLNRDGSGVDLSVHEHFGTSNGGLTVVETNSKIIVTARDMQGKKFTIKDTAVSVVYGHDMSLADATDNTVDIEVMPD